MNNFIFSKPYLYFLLFLKPRSHEENILWWVCGVVDENWKSGYLDAGGVWRWEKDNDSGRFSGLCVLWDSVVWGPAVAMCNELSPLFPLCSSRPPFVSHVLLFELSWRIHTVSSHWVFYFLSSFFFFCPHHLVCGILVPQPVIEPVPPAGNVQSLNHRTTREVPICCCSGAKSCLSLCDPMNCWGRLRTGFEGVTEDEMVGWHHPLNGHDFEQTLGESEGQGGLACCSPWGGKESDTTERLSKKRTAAVGQQKPS